MVGNQGGNQRIETGERAHLLDRAGWTPPIHRYLPDPSLRDLVRHYWIPVWSLPPGRTTEQRVLQYPVCLLVIAADYARLIGVTTGLALKELSGSGWAFGVMLQPATGSMLLGRPVTELTDTWVDLPEVTTVDGPSVTARVREEMGAEPSSEESHRRAIGVVEEVLGGLGPVDDEGLLLNRIVEYVEGRPDVLRVAQVGVEFGLSERSLQRLTARRLGLSPKWLIQRRRLHEAAERLRERAAPVDLATAAADLGYADQAHFTRDFRARTGLTPGAFAAEELASPD